MKNIFSYMKALILLVCGLSINNYVAAQCATPVITAIGNNGPICEGSTLILNASGTVGGVSSSFVRMAGIGGNYGNQAFNAVFSSGDRPGSIARLSNAAFNSIFSSQSTDATRASAIKAQYDVLLFTWASPSNTSITWGLIEAYLNLGGSVFFEDDVNIGRLSPGVIGSSYNGSYSCSYVLVNPSPFPTLVANGANGCFDNHHLRVTNWPSWMDVYIKGGNGENLAIAGIYPNGAHGRLIVQGPDQDYHAHRTTGNNQYTIILNQMDFLVANQAGITWTGPNGFTSTDANPTISNVTAANAGVYTATLTNITGGGCSTSANTTVVINSRPSVVVSGNISVFTAPGSCRNMVNYSPTISGATSVSYSLSGATTGSGSGTGSGTSFNKGVTLVSINATNACGTTPASFTITVVDNELPTITCPANISVNNTAGLCEAMVNYTAPVGSDNCPGASTVQIAGLPSGSSFPVGVTTNTFEVKDANGNKTSCSFTVTVKDNQNPTISCPADVIVNADNGLCRATNVTLGVPTTSDNCGVQGTSNDGPASYPVGTTVVTWTVSDVNGNTATCTQNVTVLDNQNPTISVSNIIVDADNGACAATNVNLGTPTTGDNCGVQGTTNDGPASYPVGTTTVNWTVTDVNGNTGTTTQTVTVIDNQNPTIACPADVTVNADNGSCAATNVSLGTPTTDDNCGVQGTSNNGLSSYPVGTTSVTWTVTDVNGNTSTCTQNVTVVDNQAPIVACKSYTLNLSGGTGTVSASDVDNNSSDNCGIAGMSVSPNTFTCADAGENTVVLTVTDIHGNSASCTTTVTVQYQPTCSIATTPANNTYTGGNPNNIYLGYGPQSATITANATGGSGFTYSWSPAANLSCTNCQSPVFTPTAAGNYTYTVTVTNSNGCSTTCTVSFCVLDARAKDNKGNYNGKVYLCHVPPGNNSNPQTLSISANAVPSHLGQHSGDRLGTCDMSCNSSAKGGRSSEEGNEESHEHSLEELATENGIMVYPNPNNGMFTLNLPSAEEAQILISNVSGQVVYRNAVSGTQKVSIDLSNNAQGIYMIQVVSGTNTYHTRVNIQL